MIDHKEHQVRRMHGSGASYRETPTSTDESTNSAIKSALLAEIKEKLIKKWFAFANHFDNFLIFPALLSGHARGRP